MHKNQLSFRCKGHGGLASECRASRGLLREAPWPRGAGTPPSRAPAPAVTRVDPQAAHYRSPSRTDRTATPSTLHRRTFCLPSFWKIEHVFHPPVPLNEMVQAHYTRLLICPVCAAAQALPVTTFVDDEQDWLSATKHMTTHEYCLFPLHLFITCFRATPHPVLRSGEPTMTSHRYVGKTAARTILPMNNPWFSGTGLR